MNRKDLNIKGLSFLIADANPFVSSICQSILRGFGATKAFEARSGAQAIKIFLDQKIDLMLCDANLPPNDGYSLIRSIRKDPNCHFRTIPIVILTNDTRSTFVARARDCGANMVIAKPISPIALYDRLAWVAFTPRKFVDSPNYFGPDRRFKIEGFPTGVGRRKGDANAAIGEETGPAMSQNDIDSLFQATLSGQS